MYKIIVFLNLSVICIIMFALQTDSELALQMYFKAKQSVNRSAHAAAQQINMEQLADGIYAIDETKAKTVAWNYLQQNLQLDEQGNPLPTSSLQKSLDIVTFQVVNHGVTFPYTFREPTLNYSVVLDRPGVVIIMRLEYPRLYRMLPPIVWHVKGVAQLTS
jgi:hypothetical protein